MLSSQPKIPEVGSEFSTAESFKEAAQQGAKAAGFAFSVSSSKLSRSEKGGHIPYILLQCVMGGEYRNNHKITEETRKRIKSTKRQNCPVTLYAVLNENAGVWVVRSYKKQHNHELLPPSQVYCLHQHRQLNAEQKELVHIMLKSGASVQSVADAVQWKHGTVYTKDIVNERDRIRNALNEGSNNDTTMQLLQKLEEHNYILRHLLSKDGYMRNLFFTHIEAASHTAEYTYEWFLNTLKEVIYDAYFCSPEVFVSDRSQALRNAANKVFPEAKKMLCIWHMLAQNLRTACQKFFDSDEDYDKLLLSVQKIAYAEEMNIVEKAFDKVKKAAMKSKDPSYIQNYLEEWKKDSECWMHVYTKNYPHMGVQSTQRAEGSHANLKKAIEAASGLDQVFSHIDRAFRQHQLQKNGAFGLNLISADPFILNNMRFEQLVGKISRWAIDRIKREICEAEENNDTNNSVCMYSLRLNFKLPCRHIILSTGLIPLSIIYPRWLLKHDQVPLLPLSLSTDTTINKTLYMLEEKYENLNDSGSKATFLQKIEALIAEEAIIPKAPLRTENIRRPASTKRDLLLSEQQDKAAKKKERNTSKFIKNIQKPQQLLYHDQIPTYMHEYIKKVTNVNGDGNCGYRALAVCLGRNENEWSEVRKELRKELIEREQFYRALFLANNDYEIILKEISWIDGPCTFEHWMRMPQVGDVITNAYQRPLYFFSLQISLTFLPHHHPLNRNKALAIAIVNNNHYVAITLKPGAPVPPIVNQWTQFATPAATRWKLLIQSRIDRFLSISSSVNEADLKNNIN
ncbi:28528_t:CDS:2 [Dentiscutata erythropus]|uniref:28528_t:CDS:1 n=1 Tax=Dentiscutata erythropus TaxID=1348616 RepID=A0A9N9NGW1_9GLOM|nr:28528_t:CDS:2 [Dentiscutata erythropus]